MRSRAAQQMYNIYRAGIGIAVTVFGFALLNLIPWIRVHLVWELWWASTLIIALFCILICISLIKFMLFYKKRL
ncbi:hypothetical protein SAMN05421799_1241 [Alicyclobacillus vulcanalis]|uniref:Uncharacterized protein n=1 Tax=Alicyclobacillus vulcanalis TaxID=252246 RepID=A0A1N7PWY2_9BACL|nr:hypothetical protein SAMN05421799_1241 [Alicyclobacillus vulcanalis]